MMQIYYTIGPTSVDMRSTQYLGNTVSMACY